MPSALRYRFEWDPKKAGKNLKDHKVSFERATQVFRDAFAVSVFDDDHSADEDRWITIGKDNNEILLVVIHTFRQESLDEKTIRIISARKAIKNELKQYERFGT